MSGDTSGQARRDYGEGALDERGPNSYRIRLRGQRDPVTGKAVRLSLTFKGTEREARRELRRLLAERDRGNGVIPSKVAFGEWSRRWLENQLGAGHITDVTHGRYEVALRLHILPALGGILLKDLRRADVKAWIDRRATEGAAAATLKKEANIVRTLLRLAVQEGLLVKNVADGVRPPTPRATSPERRALSRGEVAALLKAVEGTSLDALVRIVLATGVRQGECLAWRWRDVDWEHKRVNVHRARSRTGRWVEPKAHSRRTIEVSDVTLEILRHHRVAQHQRRLLLGEAWDDGDLIFPSEVGSPLNPSNLRRAYMAAVKRSGIDDPAAVGFHTLRHTAASLWLMNGVSLFEVARRLGHSSTNITASRYGHLLPGGQQQSAHALDALIGSA